jgi:hypothetical protein
MADGDDTAPIPPPTAHMNTHRSLTVGCLSFFCLRSEARHEPPWQSSMLFNPTGPEQPR